MVIQRIPSLFLLVAAVLLTVFIFAVPVASVPDALDANSLSAVYVTDVTELLVINAIVAALLLVCIFLFKNLKMQIKATLLTILLLVVSMATGAFILSSKMPEGTEVAWAGSAIITVLALIFALAAWSRMRRDQRTLRSLDRLR